MGALDAIVVGGGIIGLSAAEEMARRGMQVALVDRRGPGGEASWAAGGMLAADYDLGAAGPFADFGRRSRALWGELAARISSAEMPVALLRAGTIVPAADAAAMERLR